MPALFLAFPSRSAATPRRASREGPLRGQPKRDSWYQLYWPSDDDITAALPLASPVVVTTLVLFACCGRDQSSSSPSCLSRMPKLAIKHAMDGIIQLSAIAKGRLTAQRRRSARYRTL